MKTATINGIDIRYCIEGRGPWVTLSHSLATDHSMWDELAAALRDGHTVLRYDARGHGGTSAPDGPYSLDILVTDVIGLLDALAIERTHFIGLSMGGMLAQQLALRAPQRIDKLVIANSTSRVPPEAGPIWDERITQAQTLGMTSQVDMLLKRWFTAPFLAGHSEMADRVAALIAATPVAGYVGCAEAIRHLDITDRLGAITAPTLVIAGIDDPMTPPVVSEIIASAIPGACLEEIFCASHMSCLEQPEAFNHAVIEFLDGGTDDSASGVVLPS